MPCCTAQLASSSPTNTRDIQRQFLADIRRRFRELRGRIRNWVGYKQDVFQLKKSAELAKPQDVYQFDRDEGKIEAFTRWVKQRIRNDVLEPVNIREVGEGEHWTAEYLRGAYRKGWKNGTGRLMQQGVSVDNRDIETVFNLPVSRRQLRKLYTRTFENLQNITDDMADVIREELTQGLEEGVNPREMARRITKEVRSIQKSRAETLARTETVNSYSEGTLDRFEDVGVGTVKHGEWAAAMDDRTCPICEYIDGEEYTVDEMRNGTFEFPADGDAPDYLAGTYRLRPPAHPNCRCSIYPVIA